MSKMTNPTRKPKPVRKLAWDRQVAPLSGWPMYVARVAGRPVAQIVNEGPRQHWIHIHTTSLKKAKRAVEAALRKGKRKP